MIIHRQGDANTSHHTAWAGVSGLGPAPKKWCHNTLSTSTCPLVKDPVKSEMLRHFLFSFFKIASFRETKVCYMTRSLNLLPLLACTWCMQVHALQFRYTHTIPTSESKSPQNAGKHTFFRAPHLWATHCHSASAFQAHRFGPGPCVAGPDTTPLAGALGSFRMQLFGVKHFRWGWVYDFTLHFVVEFILSWCFGVVDSLKLSWVLIWGSLHFTNIDLQVAMTTEPSTLKVWIAGMLDRWFREKRGVCWSALEAKFAPAVPMKCQMLSWKLWQFWCCCTFGKKPFMIPGATLPKTI